MTPRERTRGATDAASTQCVVLGGRGRVVDAALFLRAYPLAREREKFAVVGRAPALTFITTSFALAVASMDLSYFVTRLCYFSSFWEEIFAG